MKNTGKFALLIIGGAFAVNVASFLFSNKTWIVEESKTVWIYELPRSPSPLDFGSSGTFGPHAGLVGTLFRKSNIAPLPFLAEAFDFSEESKTLTLRLNSQIRFQNLDPIRATDWVATNTWLREALSEFRMELTDASGPLWAAAWQSKWTAVDDKTLQISWDQLPSGFDLNRFLNEVLSSPLMGVVHSINLQELANGTLDPKAWVSSGPYRVRRWRAKEVILASRDDFPLGMQTGFFRVLKFQNAPVINPGADFLQSIASPNPISKDHLQQPISEELHVRWICRSWNQAGSICAQPAIRTWLVSGLDAAHPLTEKGLPLKGMKIRYRIPLGSEALRTEIRDRIRDRVVMAGGEVEEVSFFFQDSNAADLELQFITVPVVAGRTLGDRTQWADMVGRWSSRMGRVGALPNVSGEIAAFPLSFQWKGGGKIPADFDPFRKVLLEPDLSDKQMPL